MPPPPAPAAQARACPLPYEHGARGWPLAVTSALQGFLQPRTCLPTPTPLSRVAGGPRFAVWPLLAVTGGGEAETQGGQVMRDLSGSKGPPRGALETRPAECPGCTGGGRRPRGWGRGHVLVEEPGSVTGGLWGQGEDPGQPRGGELRYSVGMWPWGQVTGEDSPWPACLRVRSSGPRSRDLAEKVAMGTQRWPPRAWGACLLDSQSQEVTVRAPAQASCRLLQSGVLSAP